MYDLKKCGPKIYGSLLLNPLSTFEQILKSFYNGLAGDSHHLPRRLGACGHTVGDS